MGRVGWRPNTASLARLLDTYTGAAAAYSIRKLNSSYSGPAITVRRSSDNTSQNIGFDLNGNLDTTSLLSFVGSNNIALYSEELDNANWSKGGTTVTTNQTTAPDGTMTADLVSETGNVNHGIAPNYTPASFPTGTSWNMSVYVKKGPGTAAPNTFALSFNIGGTSVTADPLVLFSFSTGGAIETYNPNNDANFGYSMESVGDGWFRCAMWGTLTVTENRVKCGGLRFNNNLNTITAAYYTGNTQANMYIWGWQFIRKANDTSVLTTKPYTKTTATEAGNGYVSVWYDQSGNARNLGQVTSIIQPRIINAGVLETLNGKPSIYNGGSIATPWRMSVAFGTTISQPTTIFNVGASAYPGVGGGYIWDGNASAKSNGLYLSSATQIAAYAGSILSLNYSSSGSTQRLLFAKYNGASSSVAVNLGTATNGNAGTQSITGININSSQTGGNGAPGTNQQEFILWNADKATDRTVISNNINTYYSIY